MLKMSHKVEVSGPSLVDYPCGPTGDLHLILLRGFTRYESAAKVSNGDVPSE